MAFSIKNLNRTKVSQNVAAHSDNLGNKLNNVANKILDNPSQDITSLQRQYGSRVAQPIRSTVQESYLAGSNYAAGIQGVDHFTTQRDIQNIAALSAEGEASFWRKIQLARYDPSIPVDSYINSAASDITHQALNRGTVDKTAQLTSNPLAAFSDTTQYVFRTAGDDRVCPICAPLEGTIYNDASEIDFGLDNPPVHGNCRCRIIPFNLAQGQEEEY